MADNSRASSASGGGPISNPPAGLQGLLRGQNLLRPAAGFCCLSLGTIRMGGEPALSGLGQAGSPFSIRKYGAGCGDLAQGTAVSAIGGGPSFRLYWPSPVKGDVGAKGRYLNRQAGAESKQSDDHCHQRKKQQTDGSRGGERLSDRPSSSDEFQREKRCPNQSGCQSSAKSHDREKAKKRDRRTVIKQVKQKRQRHCSRCPRPARELEFRPQAPHCPQTCRSSVH